MNRRGWTWMGALCAAGVWAWAASVPAAEAQGDAAKPKAAAAGDSEADRPYLKSLMDHLKQESPDEFARLDKLRTENPEKFREVLRTRLQEMRKRHADGGEGVRPEAAAAPRAEGHAARTERGAKPDAKAHAAAVVPHPISPEAQALLDQLRKLVTNYRAAKGDEDRKAAENRIRETLSRSFEQRDRERAQRIERMEQELNRLREEMNARKQNRDDIINRKLNEVLGRDKTAW